MQATADTITIRPAAEADERALARLADLDSAYDVPAAPLLLAEVEGDVRVALSLRSGSAIANPFYPTTDIVALLRNHAARSSRRRRPARLHRRRGALA